MSDKIEGKSSKSQQSMPRIDQFGLKLTVPFSGENNDKISKTAQKSFSDSYTGTELEKPMNFLDKITKKLNDTSDKWAGKNPGGEKK